MFIRELKNKITSFSHKHYNQPYFLDTNRLLHKVRRGEDLFEREKELYDRIDDNPDVPAYLQTEENRKKFAYMLDRDPQNANFQDL
jgi:beta-1,4-mannosyl-glycoprotein beta-1,4-N-acetylglucosaminyltransferase